MWKRKDIALKAKQKGVHLITSEVLLALPEVKLFKVGLLHLFLKHTSAGLMINENADPTVRSDLNECIQRLIPDNQEYFEHVLEGSDDMPAHVKCALFGCQLTLPISNGEIDVGLWQGIYLGEFRNNGGGRGLVATLHGDPY